MAMVNVNSIDSVGGETELLAHAATYMAARLFTPRQRKSLSVLINVTREPARVPVTRAMLGPQKAGFGSKAPTLFAMTVSTAGGIRDAAETIAHEMLHISQAVNGRLLITSRKAKIAGRKTMVDMARWMGGKPVMIENLVWHLRPWEIEACHWQALLVDEFLNLSAGKVTDQPVQSPKRRQLALYPVRIASPAVDPTPVEPAIDRAAPFDSQGNSDSQGNQSLPATDPSDSNAAPADQVSAGAVAHESGPGALDVTPPEPTGSERGLSDQMPVTVSMTNGDGQNDDGQTGSVDEPTAHDIQVPEDRTPFGAMPNRPVYPRPVIEVMVPGLDMPRTLEREAMMKKLDELRQRGLAAAGESK